VWNKANNILKDILDRNISDPLNISFHMYQLDKKGNLKEDNIRFYLYYSTKSTNLIEIYYKALVCMHKS